VTIDQARRFLVMASLVFTGATFVFFLIAAAVGDRALGNMFCLQLATTPFQALLS